MGPQVHLQRPREGGRRQVRLDPEAIGERLDGPGQAVGGVGGGAVGCGEHSCEATRRPRLPSRPVTTPPDGAPDPQPGGGAPAPDGLLDVVGIGSPLVDVLCTATEPVLAGTGLVKGSMTLVDLARAEEVYDAMGAGVEVSGGSAANTMAGVAALGGAAGFVGKVADDALGTGLHPRHRPRGGRVPPGGGPTHRYPGRRARTSAPAAAWCW